MEKINQNRSENPEYIPGTKANKNFKKNTIENSILEKNLLIVTDYFKKDDIKLKRKMFDASQRNKFRMYIKDGGFYQNEKKITTCYPRHKGSMISHEKKGYAAFTLNKNGEISIFNHRLGMDGVVHSSMNAGSEVVYAGELKIIDGKLEEIVNYSGHYQPSIFNVMNVLEYFSNHGVDISKTDIILRRNNNENDEKLNKANIKFEKSHFISNVSNYKIPASEIYTHKKNNLTQDIKNEMQSIIKYHEDDSLKSKFFKFKDKVLNINLTAKRLDLSQRLYTELQSFKKIRKLENNMEKKNKIQEIIDNVKKIKVENNELSGNNGKKENSGRIDIKINSVLNLLQQGNEEIKEKEEERDYTSYKNIH